MKDYIIEACPCCEEEVELNWDIKKRGYKAYCPYCGGRLMLCSSCLHDESTGKDKGDCDYCSITDTCRHNRVEANMITLEGGTDNVKD